MNCFGQKSQEDIVRNYDIEVISHVILLPGQKKTGCSGKELKKEYYLIQATNIHTGRNEMFYAGVGSFQSTVSSNGLRELENKKRATKGLPPLTVPQLFDPLNHPSIGGGMATGGGITAGGGIVLHPCNQEIWNVMHLLITIWDINGNEGVFLDIKNQIIADPANRVPYKYIKAINTLVSRDHIITDPLFPTVNNLQDLLAYFRHHPTNPWNFKTYNFANLANSINHGIAQGWGVTQNFIQ